MMLYGNGVSVLLVDHGRWYLQHSLFGHSEDVDFPKTRGILLAKRDEDVDRVRFYCFG